MVDISSRRYDNRVWRVVRSHVRAQVVGRHREDRLGKADRRLAKIRTAPHGLQKEVVDKLVRRVLVHLDLFEDDLLLFIELHGIERRVQKHVGQDVESQRDVAIDDLCVVAGRLFVGEGVEVSADAVHRLGDLARAATWRSFKKHVFDEVGDAAALVRLGRRADVGPDPDRRRTKARHRLGENAHPVGEDRLLIHRQCVTRPAEGRREPTLRPSRRRHWSAALAAAATVRSPRADGHRKDRLRRRPRKIAVHHDVFTDDDRDARPKIHLLGVGCGGRRRVW